MGLDMCLHAEDWNGSCGLKNYPNDLQNLGELLSKRTAYTTKLTRYLIGIWHNSYAIHSWIVKNVANGVDDCREILLDVRQVFMLLKTVREVLADHSKARELLPTECECHCERDTDYDEWYFKDLEYTERLLQLVIQAICTDKYDIYYKASW